MILDKPPLIYIWRPVYRAVFEKMFWPFVDRVGLRLRAGEGEFESEQRKRWNAMERLFFICLGSSYEGRERALLDRLVAMERDHRNFLLKLDALDQHNHALESRFHELSLENQNQWARLEQLLLAVLNDPDRNVLDRLERSTAVEPRS